MRKFKYDIERYRLSNHVAKAFNVGQHDLTDLQEKRKDLLKNDPAKSREWPYNEADTKFHKEFYSYLNSNSEIDMYSLFDTFIEQEIAPLFSESFVYQKFPTFRVCLPESQAVGKWHCDSDENHGHPDGEINFQIAITDIYQSNATWIESVPGFKDFQPMELTYGEFVVFNGNKCIHGNKINVTGKSRISLDFRVIPMSNYDEYSGKISATSAKKFVIGEYYKLFKK